MPIAPSSVASAEAPPNPDAPTARPLIPSRSRRAAPPPPRASAAIAEPAPGGSAAPAAPTSAVPPPAPSGSEGISPDRAAIVLDRNPAEALRLANEHLSGFPSGELREEREVIAVEALFQLGRADEARARGKRFLEQNPGAARRSLMESVLAR